MTSRTHDLFAFTFLAGTVAYFQLGAMSLSTAVVALATGFLGGLAPDLDEPGSALWRRLPAGSGSIVGRIVAPIFGSHRFISHSIVGLCLFGFGAKRLLDLVSPVVLVDMNVVWWGFVLGVVSHLVADSLTVEGVPWLWPLKWKFGFPPFAFLRIKTGGFLEKFLVFPALLGLNGALFYYRYQIFLNFIKGLV